MQSRHTDSAPDWFAFSHGGLFCSKRWPDDQTFAREAKCWMKMFDLDQTWETI